MQARLARSAFAAMLRTAVNDPVWALSTIVASPVRLGRYIIGSLILLIGVGLVLIWTFHAVFSPRNFGTMPIWNLSVCLTERGDAYASSYRHPWLIPALLLPV